MHAPSNGAIWYEIDTLFNAQFVLFWCKSGANLIHIFVVDHWGKCDCSESLV